MDKQRFPIFAQRLRQFRLAQDLTQADLALRIAAHPTCISHYETMYRVPSLAMVVALAEALGVTTDDLLGQSTRRLTPCPYCHGSGFVFSDS
jgi:repressor LexA